MNNQVKLIDADKLRIWLAKRMHHPRIYGDPFKCVLDAMLNGEFDPDTPPVPTIKPGDKVYHKRFKAQGKVKKISASGKRAYVVWFDGYVPSYVSLDSLEVVE
ncbi:hypothetical protein ACPV3A_16520 [Paenibacillus sp. Dod16]|uniref:hypothetical protein n=1 Tax=Paenibacillus sp. Dod16 TaxID=3416392 RepID=UPI003CF790BD